MDTRSQLLDTVLFSGLPEAAGEAARRGEERSFHRGTVVFSPQKAFPALGVVLEGYLEVTRGTMRMDTLGPGDLFGAAALFDNRRYPSTLQAKGDCRVLFFPRALMEELFERYPTVATRYIAYLSERVSFLSERLDALSAGKGADKLLCFLADRGGRLEGVSGKKLADMLGLSRATLYRAMDQMVERGLLKKTGMTLELTNKEETKA